MNEEKKAATLERHGGCIRCTRKCLHNGPCATPDKAAESKGKLFDCNSEKRS